MQRLKLSILANIVHSRDSLSANNKTHVYQTKCTFLWTALVVEWTEAVCRVFVLLLTFLCSTLAAIFTRLQTSTCCYLFPQIIIVTSYLLTRTFLIVTPTEPVSPDSPVRLTFDISLPLGAGLKLADHTQSKLPFGAEIMFLNPLKQRVNALIWTHNNLGNVFVLDIPRSMFNTFIITKNNGQNTKKSLTRRSGCLF